MHRNEWLALPPSQQQGSVMIGILHEMVVAMAAVVVAHGGSVDLGGVAILQAAGPPHGGCPQAVARDLVPPRRRLCPS